MKTLLTCSVLALAFATAQADDTLRVETAGLLKSVEMQKPFASDSVNMKGKAFDAKSLLDDNKNLIYAANAPIATLHKGEPIASSENGTLRLIRFTLSTPRFAKAKINVSNLANYKLYNGDKELGGELKLQPGRHDISLLCFTTKADKDSFNVSITGKSLEGVSLGNEGKRPYTMAEMIQGPHYRNVRLSPSGKYLITVYYDTDAKGKNTFRTTLTTTRDSKTLLRLSSYSEMEWLHDKDIAYFTRKGENGRELVTYSPATGKETTVCTHLPEGGFTLSPKADYLIFNLGQEADNSYSPLKRLMSPDDRQPGWRNRNALYKYDIANGTMQRITFGKSYAALHDISLDGKWLLVGFAKQDLRRRPFDRTTLVRINAQSLEADTLLADTTFLAGARFMPDGKSLLVKASPAAFGSIGSEVAKGQIPNGFDYRLYAYDIANGKAKPLLPGFAPSVGEFEVSETNGNIYFRATDGCDESLFCLDPKSGKVVKFELPVSYIQGYSLALQPKTPYAVFFGQTGTTARQMYGCSLDGERPKARPMGEIDFGKMSANWAIGSCHDWAFKSSRGDSIKGFYLLPPDFDKTRKYPVIVYYYGGCTPTAKTLEFHYPFQVLASQGYVVYVVEPSGAIGYGQEFAARHVNTWGDSSADDIIEGTKAFLQAHPWANAKKVGCMGASYGGFMTQYLQTRTDIFATAISHAGISDITSYWGGGYWGYSYGEVAQYGSFPWNNPDLYVKHSPLFNADKIHTPMLLIHGTADTNVPTTESLQLYTALRILGRPVSMVLVDKENHVVVDYDKRMAWQNAIFAWMAYWLKDQHEWWEELFPGDDFGQ